MLYGNQVQLSSTNKTLKLATITDQPGSLNYTLSLWVYVINWTTADKYNTILNINTSSAVTPGPNSTSKYATTPTPSTPTTPPTTSKNYILYLDLSQPNLYLFVPSSTGTAGVNGDILITNNFPVQSWVFISMSMQGNRGDFYINGKLIGSQKLCPDGSMICAPFDTIELGVPSAMPGVDQNATTTPNMYIANVQRISSASTLQQVWTSYLAGNGVSSTNMSSYGFDFGLTQNGQVVSQFKM